MFFFIQIKEYKTQGEKYKLINSTNVGIFVLIYILLTIVLYLLLDNEIDQVHRDYSSVNDNVDPTMLKKITENMYTSFDPMVKRLD